MKSVVTEYDGICFLCGRAADGQHHLIFGRSERKLADEDGLKVPVCNRCHNAGAILEKIHGNPVAEKMSKMIGQLAWEKSQLTDDPEIAREIRKMFMDRYGKSYL